MRIVNLRTLVLLAACAFVLLVPAAAMFNPEPPNEIINGTFDDGLNYWGHVSGEVITTVLGNPAPAAQCNKTTSGWGDRIWQIVDDYQNPFWDPNLHAKIVDLQADIAVLVKDGAIGGVRFQLGYCPESYNNLEMPQIDDPAFIWLAPKGYIYSENTWFTTKHPYQEVLLPEQPRWIAVVIDFWQPANSINLVDNVILRSKCVPEPAVMTVFAFGLANLVASRLFRKK